MKAMVIDGFGGADKLHWAEVPDTGRRSRRSPDQAGRHQCQSGRLEDPRRPARQGHATRIPAEFPVGMPPGRSRPSATASVTSSRATPSTPMPASPWCAGEPMPNILPSMPPAVAFAPRGLSLETAAALPLVGLTSWQVLFDTAALEAGQTVLIHAGAGGIGSLAIQLAKVKGARVITTARAENHAYVKGFRGRPGHRLHRRPFADSHPSRRPRRCRCGVRHHRRADAKRQLGAPQTGRHPGVHRRPAPDSALAAREGPPGSPRLRVAER